jgi:antitoxin (DNA-binding transcriptional repressor) of toxin-antitoxin stability system
MQTAISSTEAVRNFSELLNNIKYRGDRYTVIRGGKAAATLGPAEPSRPVATMSDLRDTLDKGFGADIKEAVQAQPLMQKAATWE